MLLNHTSGLQDYEDLMPQPDPKLPVGQTQIDDLSVVELLKHQNSTKFAPGSKWEYSNSGYVLLGVIVRKVSGESFPDFLHDRIFSPLQMNNTVAYVHGKNEVPNRAFGHSNADETSDLRSECVDAIEIGVVRRLAYRQRAIWCTAGRNGASSAGALRSGSWLMVPETERRSYPSAGRP